MDTQAKCWMQSVEQKNAPVTVTKFCMVIKLSEMTLYAVGHAASEQTPQISIHIGISFLLN